MDWSKADINNECAFDKGSGVCSPNSIIEKIAETVDASGGPSVVIDQAKKDLGCASESCVVSHPIIVEAVGKSTAEHVKSEYFKPDGPTDNSWFNNFNIDEVLEQWASKWPGFYHMNFQTVDFEEIKSELATINIADLLSKYDCLGVVLNTDKSTGPGQHWFCLFCDFRNMTLEYFNSSGTLPPKEVQAWLVKTKYVLEGIGMKPEIVVASRIVHQLSNTECGPYSLYYIYSRLNGIPHSHFARKRVPDSKMREFRQLLFRKSS